MRDLLKRYWVTLRRPSAHYSLGFLTFGGFLAGLLFWGGFHTVLEFTNSERFCTSCHEMEVNVFAELKHTVHFNNRSGVRATCSDCHVPHEWTNMLGRKMEASKEVWGWVFGTINTPEKFEARRLEMAEREWRRLGANDSLECRNCHNLEFMDYAAQSPMAQRMHGLALGGEIDATCIDCHKGIAHRLPDMDAVPQWPSAFR